MTLALWVGWQGNTRRRWHRSVAYFRAQLGGPEIRMRNVHRGSHPGGGSHTHQGPEGKQIYSAVGEVVNDSGGDAKQFGCVAGRHVVCANDGGHGRHQFRPHSHFGGTTWRIFKCIPNTVGLLLAVVCVGSGHWLLSGLDIARAAGMTKADYSVMLNEVARGTKRS